MIGKQLFLETTELDGALEIVNETIGYAESLHRSGTLRPAFYDDVLLLAAEILRHVENQGEWIDLGYQICREFKQTMERCGCRDQPSMLSGLGYRCFAVREFCEQTHLLPGFSRSMDHLLFVAADHKVEQARKGPTLAENYDMLHGISGTLYYLLDCDCTREEKKILVKCIRYLLTLDQKAFRDGSLRLGLAHGMLGPLIALAKACAKGFAVDGLQEGIEKLYRLYEIYQSGEKADVPYWPEAITVEEDWEKACRPEHLHRYSSWCDGNLGILRGLQKISAYMNWPQREREYLQAMKGFLAQNIKAYSFDGPSLRHGYSGLVAVQTGTYSVYEDPGLLTNLERNVQEIIKGYRTNNRQDLSLLTGSLGITVALLSLQGKVRAGKLLMID